MKSKIIILIVALTLCATCVTIGLVVGSSTHNENLTPSTPTEPVITLPEVLPDLNVEHGVYYFIGSTHTTWRLDAEALDFINRHAITLTIGDPKASGSTDAEYSNTYTFKAAGKQTGIAYSQDNTIVFDDGGAAIRESFDINATHDDVWYQQYGKKESPWTCTYDAETQTITISHNSDFALFRLFESDSDYADYLKANCMQDDAIVVTLYPEPINNSTEQKGQ